MSSSSHVLFLCFGQKSLVPIKTNNETGIFVSQFFVSLWVEGHHKCSCNIVISIYKSYPFITSILIKWRKHTLHFNFIHSIINFLKFWNSTKFIWRNDISYSKFVNWLVLTDVLKSQWLRRHVILDKL